MKTLVVVQARLGSTRLPKKILLPLAGQPLLLRMLERVKAAESNFELVVATTTDTADDAVADLAKGAGYDVFRGHPTDLLDRHYRAAKAWGAKLVLKIPSDCPLIDPQVIDRVLKAHLAAPVDFTSNLHPATYPDGNDVEVMPMKVLEEAWKEAKKPHEREHTTPFIWDQPERYRCQNVRWERGLDFSMSHRFTIDYAEDYEFIKAVYDALWSPERIFSLDDILGLLEARPEIHRINEKYLGVNWYRNHLAELKTVKPSETRKLEQL